MVIKSSSKNQMIDNYQSSNSVVTRFAPSPTGKLHIGGLRTALFAYLLAKNKEGKFYLRIEDTDSTRSSDSYAQQLINCLKWAGINWDDEVIYQSTRINYYKKHIDKLLQTDYVYRCFEDQKSSGDLTKVINNKKQKPYKKTGYRSPSRDLTADQIAKNLKDNKKFTIRVKMPLSGCVQLADQLRQDLITYQYKDLDDFIIVKSDGMPTYHLAHVLDDMDLGVTDVLRGNEWIPTFAVHDFLWKALSKKMPRYYHLPLILSQYGGKVSKRDSSNNQELVILDDIINKHYLPEALINYVALLGWSYQDRDFFTKQELIKYFDCRKINVSSAKHSQKKMDFISNKYIQNLDKNKYRQLVTQYFKSHGPEYLITDFKDVDLTNLNNLVVLSELYQSRLNNLAMLDRYLEFYHVLLAKKKDYSEKKIKQIYLDEFIANEEFKPDDLICSLKISKNLIVNYNFANDAKNSNLFQEFKKLAKNHNKHLSYFLKPLRISITRIASTPSIAKIVQIIASNLGSGVIHSRLDHDVKILQSEIP